MKKKYKLIVVLLLIALVVTCTTLIIKAYFPELIAFGWDSTGGGAPGGSVKIYIESPASPGVVDEGK